MNNVVVIDGDELKFETDFDTNIVKPTGPCLIQGSGEAYITNKKICVLGDESKISIAATYTKSTHTKPGTGTITIAPFTTNQQAAFVTARTAVIVVGGQFTALFTPSSPAVDLQGKQDSNMEPTQGTGTFINSQSFVTAG